MPLILLMARHGETDLNVENRWQGRLDIPLNETGFAQARALTAGLPDRIDAIVSSPLLRARQTAEVVASARSMSVSFHPDFRERDFGVFEGRTFSETLQCHPDLACRWDIEPTGAEAARAVVDRVAAALGRLRQRHPGKTVLLVSHGFVVRCLRYLVDGVADEEFFDIDRIPNGSFLAREIR